MLGLGLVFMTRYSDMPYSLFLHSCFLIHLNQTANHNQKQWTLKVTI